MAFSAQQVCRLTRLTARQLAYWDGLGFFIPEHFSDDSKRFGRVYSFRDVVGLRTIALLREAVSLQHLRHLGEWLKEHLTEDEAHWSRLKFYVKGRQVLFVDPRTEKLTSSRPIGQMVFEVPIEPIVNEIRGEIARLRERQPEHIGRITRNRHILHNRPIIAGTRIPTSAVWSFHEAGYTIDDILKQYPDLKPEDVERAIEHERLEREKKKAAS